MTPLSPDQAQDRDQDQDQDQGRGSQRPGRAPAANFGFEVR